jgi:hypothetical protein
MALIISIVTAILFQAYIAHVLSDLKTGETFDKQAQYEAERVAIGNMLKESILQYYECPRFSNTVNTGSNPKFSTIFQSYLTAMQGTSVTYAFDASTFDNALPSSAYNSLTPSKAGTFWQAINAKKTAGDNFAIGGFYLVDRSVPSLLQHHRIAQFMPDTANVLAVQTKPAKDQDNGIQFTVTRTDTGSAPAITVTYDYYVRMFQVPGTDFNLISYAVADTSDDIPSSMTALPAAMKTDLANKTTYGLCMSKMDADNELGTLTAYPYMYRELFSSASSVWEWALYSKDYITQYFPTASGNSSYLIDMAASPLDESASLVTYTATTSNVLVSDAGCNASGVPQSGTYTSSGFTPRYYTAADKEVNRDGYPVVVTPGKNYTYDLKKTDHVASETNVDNDPLGLVTESDSIADGVPQEDIAKVKWTLDLGLITTTTTINATAYRCIYIKLPQDHLTDNWTSELTITDSTQSIATPVVICIEGWGRYNTSVTPPVPTSPVMEYPIHLSGNLTHQQVLIYAVGAALDTTSATSMNGVLMLDDRLGSLSIPSGSPLTLNGLLVWNGNKLAPPGSLTIKPLSNGTADDNAFRPLAPRFLLVDVQGKTSH